VAAAAVDGIATGAAMNRFRVVATVNGVVSGTANDDFDVVLDVVGFLVLAVVCRAVNLYGQVSQAILVVHAIRAHATVEGVAAVGSKGGDEPIVAGVAVEHVDVLAAIIRTGAAIDGVVAGSA